MSLQPEVDVADGYPVDIAIPGWLILLGIGLLGLTVMRYRILSRRKPPMRKT